MIEIPTHGVNLWHHGLQLAKRKPKSPIEPSQGERGRKKERWERKKERGGKKRVGSILAGQSRRMDRVTESRHVHMAGTMPQWSLVAPVHMSRLHHKSCQSNWHNWKRLDLKKSFDQFISQILIKKGTKYKQTKIVRLRLDLAHPRCGQHDS
jgi:hypothetical protein